MNIWIWIYIYTYIYIFFFFVYLHNIRYTYIYIYNIYIYINTNIHTFVLLYLLIYLFTSVRTRVPCCPPRSMVPHLPFQNLYLRYLKRVRATASHPHALFPVGMQPGVCFGKETELLTGERVIFLVETNVYRRQKGLFYKPKITFFSLPKLWPERSGKENKCFPPKTNLSHAEK